MRLRTRRVLSSVRRLVRHSRLAQIGLLVGFWALGTAVARIGGLPLPGGIVGMMIVLALLATHRLNPASMRRGADWFLADLLLFFVPAVLAVLDHRELLGLVGLKILAVILLGTVAVMGVTGLTVDLCHRWRVRHVPADRV